MTEGGDKVTDEKEFEIMLLKHDTSKRKIADYLGISLSSLYNKLSNISEFKASEIQKISTMLNLTVEEREKIFFAQLVELNSTNQCEA